jgi:calcineurin-like phosphoesterase family protein
MGELFFTADTHLGHTNIIKYCNRPFVKDGYYQTDLMDETIISNINKVVSKNDILWHLGDFCFAKTQEKVKEYRNRINCSNIHLVLGNHDNESFVRNIFHTYKMYELRIQNCPNITMCHFAMLRWNKSHHGSYHTFGHSHGNLNNWIQEYLPHMRMLDVGVDSHNFMPWSLNEIKSYMDLKKGEQLND